MKIKLSQENDCLQYKIVLKSKKIDFLQAYVSLGIIKIDICTRHVILFQVGKKLAISRYTCIDKQHKHMKKYEIQKASNRDSTISTERNLKMLLVTYQ